MARSDNLTGALLMMGAMAGFTISDTMMKMMAGQIPLHQVMVLRGLVTTAAVAFIAYRMGAFSQYVPRSDWHRIALRTVAEVAAAYFFLTALFNMPLANVVAIMQALPLSLALAAALFLREPLGWRRLTAILAGFAGVMLIVRPGTEGFNSYALYCLAAICCVTVRDLVTRRLSRAVPSMLVTFITSLAVMTAFGLGGLGSTWVPMDLRDVLLTAGAGVFVVSAYLFSIMTMRVGEISYIAPFRYTALIWALVLGWLVFAEWPGPLTLLGAAIVVGSGLFTLYREARLGLRRSVSPPPPRH